MKKAILPFHLRGEQTLNEILFHCDSLFLSDEVLRICAKEFNFINLPFLEELQLCHQHGKQLGLEEESNLMPNFLFS